MSQYNLIENLSRDLKPSQASRWFRARALLIFLASLPLIGFFLYTSPKTPMRLPRLTDLLFLAELGSLFLIYALSLRLTVRSAVPGRPIPAKILGWLVSLFVLWLMAYHGQATLLSPRFGFGLACSLMILSSTLLPMVLGLFLLRQGACTQPRKSLLFLWSSSFCLGLAAQHFLCPDESFWHLFWWHGAPYTLGLPLVYLGSKKWLRF